MPTPDRTTIKAAIDAVIGQLETNLVADPPSATSPFRRVAAGVAGTGEYPRPFLTVAITSAQPVAVVDDDKIVEIGMRLRVVTDILESDPHDAMLAKVGAVEDFFDSVLDSGIIDGAEGFDLRDWKLEYPAGTSGARTGVATANGSCIVKVEREQNRVPAV